MIRFKKYNPIEISFNREFMEKIAFQMRADMEYVVQEKVHGSNTSFLCDGKRIVSQLVGGVFCLLVSLAAVFAYSYMAANENLIKNIKAE